MKSHYRLTDILNCIYRILYPLCDIFQMSINTSNTLNYRSGNSQNMIDSNRREVYGSSSSREQNMLSNQVGIPNSLEDIDYDLVYRVKTFPDQIGFDQLVKSKEVLHHIINDFFQNDQIKIDTHKKQEYSKRLMLLQKQIDGVMRQNFAFQKKGQNGGVRTIDYNSFINQKQNQIVQLERKIASLETLLRIKDKRQKQLQSELQKRFALLKSKNDQIQKLRNSSKSYSQFGKPQPEIVNGLIRTLTVKLEQLAQKGSSVAQMENEVQGWILGLPNDSALKRKLRAGDEAWIQDKYRRFVAYLTVQPVSMVKNLVKQYTNQIESLKSKGISVDYDRRILDYGQLAPVNLIPTEEILASSNVINNRDQRLQTGLQMGILSNYVNSGSTTFGRVPYMNYVSKVVEVPVQDSRTKALIHKLTSQMRRLYQKYPQLSKQISPELSEYFSQQLIDVIEVDQLDRLVEIVKYKPDVVKVENVYAYSSQKSRKVQFHLRVLIKALLDQMERMKNKTGCVPELDQGVIGMIQQQIMDVVDVDDILKVYRVVPKIVEVQKVVQQVVQKLVPVPHFARIDVKQMEVVPVKQVQVVKDTINVPYQVPRLTELIREKLIQVPQYHQKVVVETAIQEKIIQLLREVPKQFIIQKVVPLIQQQIKIETQVHEKLVQLVREVIKQVIVKQPYEVRTYEEKMKIVPQIEEKIVTIIKEIPKIIEVQKFKQVIVPVKQYIESQRVEHHVRQVPVEVNVVEQRLIAVDRIIDRIKQVPQYIQKIVPVYHKQVQIKEVQVTRQVPFRQQVVKPVQIIKQVPVRGRNTQVIKQVERIVQVPLIQERVKPVPYRETQVLYERQNKVIRQPVRHDVPQVLVQQKVVEVIKPEIHEVVRQVPFEVQKQIIVPLETVREQLIPAPCIVQKIIQKIVEVPRVVEVQKIVQKIVIVPRIVQKIVEVQKIVQKIVERTIYSTQIKQIHSTEQVPYEVQRLKLVEVPNYIIERVQVAKMFKQQVPCVTQIVRQIQIPVQVKGNDIVVIQRKQYPVQLFTDKIVTQKIQDFTEVFIKEQVLVQVERQVPVNIQQVRIVQAPREIPLIVQVDRVVKVNVPVQVQLAGQVVHHDRQVQKLFVQKDYEIHENRIPVYNDRILEVKTIEQKIIPPVKLIEQRVVEVNKIVEKIINNTVEVQKLVVAQVQVPMPYKFEYAKVVDVTKQKIVTLNKCFAEIVQRIHEVPILQEKYKEIEKKLERIVVQKHQDTKIKQCQVLIQKAVIQDKIQTVTNYINQVNQVLKIVQEEHEVPKPIIIYEQKILQVPVIIQKIAQRIVVMPQIVQILKYIHEITDNESLGMALTGQIGIQQAQYQRLAKSVNGELSSLRGVLQSLRSDPNLKNQIVSIDRFLAEFNKFVAYPRIRQIINEKVVQNVVEKDRIVKVPVKSADDEKRGLASAVLIDKLIIEVKKLRQQIPNAGQYKIDPQILFIFGDQLEPISQKYGNDYNKLLDEYSKTIYSRFNMYGTWTMDHQRMLKQFIDERFDLAASLRNKNRQANKYQLKFNKINDAYQREKTFNENVRRKVKDIQEIIRQILLGIVDMSLKRKMEEQLTALTSAVYGYALGSDTITYQLKQMSELDKERVDRYIREKDSIINQLRITIQNLKRQIERNSRRQTPGQLVYGNCQLNHYEVSADMQNQLNELRKYREVYGSIANGSKSSVNKAITSGATGGLAGGVSQAEYSRVQTQVTRIRSELTRSKQQISKLEAQLRRLREVQIQHNGCAKRIRQLEERLRLLISENDKYQKQLVQLRSVKQTKRTNITTPQRQIRQGMSDSYGTNFMEYVQGGSDANSSGIRSSRAEFYEKGVYRSGGNYGPIGSPEHGTLGNNSSGSVSGLVGTLGRSTSGTNLLQAQQGNVTTSVTGGGYNATSNLGSGINSGTYNPQKSANYLSDSRGSGVSGVNSISRAQVSSKSSRTGENQQTYGYQQTYQKESSAVSGGSITQTNQMITTQQRYSRISESGQIGQIGQSGQSGQSIQAGKSYQSNLGQSYQSSQGSQSLQSSQGGQSMQSSQAGQSSQSGSRLYGTSAQQIVQRTVNRQP